MFKKKASTKSKTDYSCHDIDDPQDPNIARLMAKINTLYHSEECPFVLVGSVYLDIILRPIITTLLEKKEWDNLDHIRFASI